MARRRPLPGPLVGNRVSPGEFAAHACPQSRRSATSQCRRSGRQTAPHEWVFMGRTLPWSAHRVHRYSRVFCAKFELSSGEGPWQPRLGRFQCPSSLQRSRAVAARSAVRVLKLGAPRGPPCAPLPPPRPPPSQRLRSQTCGPLLPAPSAPGTWLPSQCRGGETPPGCGAACPCGPCTPRFALSLPSGTTFLPVAALSTLIGEHLVSFPGRVFSGCRIPGGLSFLPAICGHGSAVSEASGRVRPCAWMQSAPFLCPPSSFSFLWFLAVCL